MGLENYKSYITFKYTFLEILKSNIHYGILLLGGLIIFSSYIAYSFSYGVPIRITLDVGLGVLSLSSVVMAIWLGSNLIYNEIESKTIYMVLSRSISRSSYILGKILAIELILLINQIYLGFITISLFALLGGAITSKIFIPIFFAFIESAIILIIVVIFSLLTNPTLTIIYGVVVYIIGNTLNETLFNLFAVKNPFIFTILKVFNVFIPNFSKFNYRELIVYEQNIPVSILLYSLSYGLVYLLAIYLITTLIFRFKNLE